MTTKDRVQEALKISKEEPNYPDRSKMISTGQSFTAFLYNLTKLMKPQTIFEWGPGQSTHAFLLGDKDACVVSYEHDSKWAVKYEKDLLQYKELRSNVRLVSNTFPGSTLDYLNVQKYPNESMNIVLVDGDKRRLCFTTAERLVKNGGVVLVHDSNSSVLWSKPETNLTYIGEHEDPIQGETTSIYIKE